MQNSYVVTLLALLCATLAPAIQGADMNKVKMDESATVKGPEKDAVKGVERYIVTSQFQVGPNAIEVLLPDKFDPAKKYSVLYVLPVETGIGGYFGDGLMEMKKLDAHNKYNLILVAPAFDTVPWFGANATNPKIRHEEYLMKVVVPLIESRYPTPGTREGRLLFGFSKSGWGAFSLLLRNPDFFGYAASWDAPLMVDWPANWGIAEHFGTKENFEKYQISRLFDSQAKYFKERSRLALTGSCLFLDAVKAHEKMDSLGIKHYYANNLRFPHTWKSEGAEKFWIQPVLDALVALSRATEK